MKYPRIYAAVFDSPWAIQLTKLEAIIELIEFKAAGGMYSAEELQARTGDAGPQVATTGGIAVLPMMGVISQRMNMMAELSGPGGTSTEQFGRQLDAAVADPAISAIVFNIDSPGGSVFGVEELANKIHAARGSKPMVAVSNSLAASAAYWLAAAADEVVVTPSGEVGSIGVYGMHQDVSAAQESAGVKTTFVSAGRFKTEGNSFEPLGSDAQAAMQGRVDDYYRAFVSAVARGRGTTVDAVANGFAEGRVVGAQQAVKLGMADRVATLDQTIARLANPRTRARVGQRAAERPLEVVGVDKDRIDREVSRRLQAIVDREHEHYILNGTGEDEELGVLQASDQVEPDPTDDFYYQPLPPKGSAADLDLRRRRARLHGVV